MAESINAFSMAQSQFDHVARLLNLDPDYRVREYYLGDPWTAARRTRRS